jgi:sulfur-oxidizing protein SoxY
MIRKELAMSAPVADWARIEADRRMLLRLLALAGFVGGVVGTSAAGSARAADMPAWPKEAFSQKNQAAALKALGVTAAEPSAKIALTVPEIAENGAVVPVGITADLPDVQSIAVLIPQNPFSLIAFYQIPAGTAASVSCRVKMAQTSQLIALVGAGGTFYTASREVKVTAGGCG